MDFILNWFLFGFPIVVFVYYLIPDKAKRFWLLVISYLFVMLAMPQALVWLVGITGISYLLGRAISRKKNKLYIIGSVCVLASFLLCSRRLGALHTVLNLEQGTILAPIGISFYMLQAIAYLVEVYKGNIQDKLNFWDYVLYLSFFPKFMSGPIERPEKFLPQIQTGKKLPEYEVCKRAAFFMLWGYFEKIVVADHAAIVVNMIFEEYAEHTGFILLCGAILYGIQLYADFDGYCHIALGAAEFLGYHITINFERPYFSRSVGEFWRRWHISLSSWLKDYIYIPLGGSRRGSARTYINLIITFFVSGIWHGAGMKFIFWGMLHGGYQVISRLTGRLRAAVRMYIRINTKCFSYHLFQGILTFLMVDFAWIFFRADSLRQGVYYVRHMCTNFALSQVVSTSIYGLNIEPVLITTMLVGIIVVLVRDILTECRIDILEMIGRQNFVFRWAIYLVICLYVVCAYVQMIGIDVSQFIYGQF